MIRMNSEHLFSDVGVFQANLIIFVCCQEIECVYTCGQISLQVPPIYQMQDRIKCSIQLCTMFNSDTHI